MLLIWASEMEFTAPVFCLAELHLLWAFGEYPSRWNVSAFQVKHTLKRERVTEAIGSKMLCRHWD